MALDEKYLLQHYDFNAVDTIIDIGNIGKVCKGVPRPRALYTSLVDQDRGHHVPMCFTYLDRLYSIQLPILHPSVGGADRAIEDSPVHSFIFHCDQNDESTKADQISHEPQVSLELAEVLQDNKFSVI